jgi:glucose dehydrogenase
MITRKKLMSSLILSAGLLASAPVVWGQTGTDVSAGDWPVFHGNEAAQRYSPLDQINADNVQNLRLAWSFPTANIGDPAQFNATFTPLAVDGVLYMPVGQQRDIAAVDATSGQLLWFFRVNEPQERFDPAPRKGAGRGVAFWADGEERRILTITPGFYLISLDADTGIPDPNFGDNGRIDMQQGLRLGFGRDDIDIGSSMPPFIMNDTVVVGPAMAVSMRPPSRSNVKGDVRAFDVRTGEHRWTFKTIPEEGEYGYDTWLEGSAEYTGNTGVWAPISGDPELGLVYLPVESATGDRYGGDRPGDNLYSGSIVAVDVETGEKRWYYQTVRHDIWDWDIPAAPILADLPNGRKVLMQVTKQSWVFTLDRETGEPIWPIEDLPVPQGDVPGEWYAATQPHPTRPAAFDRQGVTIDDLIDYTPELREAAIEAVQPWRLGHSVYSPPSLRDAPDGTIGTLSLPSVIGGANWEGAAVDPETGMLYVGSRTVITPLSVAPDPESDVAYSQALGVRVPRISGLPLVKPPYGRITAIDMNSGDHAWMIANADTPEAIANNPALEGLDLPRTGNETRSGLLVTKTLLFSGEGVGGGPTLRAHDKATGEILAEIEMPGTQTGLPFTYMVDGKQYIAMVVSPRGRPSELVAYALP